MKKIISFKSEKEFELYRQSKAKKELGSGAEGTCYLGKDGLVYKDFVVGFEKIDYDPYKIITTDDFSTEAFIFPDVLFLVNNRLVGFTSKYIKRNLIDIDLIDDDYLKTFDFDKFLNAYKRMIIDVDELSRAGIRIYDLSANLMYDGDRLYGIDTCGYTRSSKDILSFNRACLDDAVKCVFKLMDACLYENDIIDTSLDVESYIRAIEKRYKSDEYCGGGYVKK